MEQTLNVTKYIDMALRRKWWIIIPFLLVLLGGMTYLLSASKVYQAETLIFIQPQKVPEEYVRAIVTTSVEDRLKTITQQVTSRTNLENIIKRFNLFSERKRLHLEDKVQLMRERIKVEVSQPSRRRGSEVNSFTISFQYTDPRKAAEVTNALASNFISENLKMRETQAIGTSSFLANELASVKKRLAEKEEELKQYRVKYMGGLPEQLQTNLSILERLQAQLDQYNENLRDAENRKILLQQQIADAKASQSLEASRLATPSKTEKNNLPALKRQLAMLESRYTSNHPDVIRLRETIKKLEASQENAQTDEVQPSRFSSTTPDITLTLRRQLDEVNLEIKRLKSEITDTRSQIALYQKRVEETPKREQELLALNRDYENLKELYNSLLSRKLEAEIAVSLEKKQKGEQFRVIDPAKVPNKPIKPDIKKIVLMTFVLAIGLGGGLAYFVEMMDTSFKDPEEVEKELGLPVLLSLPIRYTERELRRMKAKKVLAYASVSIGFLASVFGILVATKGLEKSIQFFTDFIGHTGG
ncbi:MAG: protein GumC [Deltaproteobacteria bacterium]|nr:protein GumC [Deltaproteobacteria bacterium]MBW1929185.1 protein GumC [Deltaproteobacteria bacterium]MBW2127036.1 protein GumC [Deltaproteobacteria bacterium]